jgi:hypothetical protein
MVIAYISVVVLRIFNGWSIISPKLTPFVSNNKTDEECCLLECDAM